MPNNPDYQLIRQLGAGAFGEVWHAHGPGGLAVALKFIRLNARLLEMELRSLEVMKTFRHFGKTGVRKIDKELTGVLWTFRIIFIDNGSKLLLS